MKPNVILIVCDTLRRDIMQAYGGPVEMPSVGALARDSMVYDNCIAPGTWTFPSHVSLFTGLYPSRHGIHEKEKVEEKVHDLWEPFKKLSAPRLAEQMQAEDYETICISNNYMINEHAGFKTGFDEFINIQSSPWSQSKLVWQALDLGRNPLQILLRLLSMGRLGDIFRYGVEFVRIKWVAFKNNYPINKGARRTVDMLADMDLDEFFLFINFWEMHEPYKGFSDEEHLKHLAGIEQLTDVKIERMRREYVKEAIFLDAELGRLFDILKRRGLYDSTMIILTSDHGQEFNEHGYMMHGSQLHDEITRIPLIIKYPQSRKFRKREGYQSLVSIPQLIEDVIAGRDDRRLTTRAAFAEVYSHVEFVPKSMLYLRKKLEDRYDKVRKAVYMDGYKLTYNYTDGKVEEFLRNGKAASLKKERKIAKKLIGELRRFSRHEHLAPPRL